MDKQQKKQIKRILSWVCLGLLTLFLAVMPLLAGERNQEEGPQASILTSRVQRQDLQTQLIGGGQLAGSASVDITIPEEIKLTAYRVHNGDSVREGDPVATVDRVSVMAALASVQETLDYLSDQLADISSDTESGTVTAQAGGLVKVIYARKGESVQDVMLRDGALAILSLDGRMAVTIEAKSGLSYGDAVIVCLPDDREAEGRVESNLQGILTVSLPDEDYPIGAAVTVQTMDDVILGRGELYIHSPWTAAAYHGTVEAIEVSEGDTVSAGRRLFRLETSGHTAQFQILTSQRQEYEALMQELFQMYQSGVITAPCDGLVSGVDADGSYLLSAGSEEPGWFLQLLSGQTGGSDEGDPGQKPPGGEEIPGDGGDGDGDADDTPEYTYSVLAGQVIASAEGTVILAAYPQLLPCNDLSEIQINTALMTASISRSLGGVTVYQKDLTTPYANPIVAGDILFFVTHSSGSNYVVWAGNQPLSSGGIGIRPGGFGGYSGSAPQTFTPYSLETIPIATVTSQEKMTLDISIDEQDITRLSVGQAADVTVEALTGQHFPAIVTAVSNSGTNQGGSSKFSVTIQLEKSGDMLPGMNASAYLTLHTAENALCIPAAALVEDGSRTIVYTRCDEKSEQLSDPVTVVTGLSDGEYVEVVSGLSEGDTIFYSYYDTLESGGNATGS